MSKCHFFGHFCPLCYTLAALSRQIIIPPIFKMFGSSLPQLRFVFQLHNQFSFIFVPKNTTKLFVNQYQFSVDEHNNCYIFCRTLDKIDESLLTRKGCVIFFQGRNQSSNYQVICPILVQGYFLDDLRPRK